MLSFLPVLSILVLAAATTTQPVAPPVSASIPPGVQAQPRTVSLRLAFRSGEALRYRLTSTSISDFEAQPGAPASRAIISQSYTVTIRIGDRVPEATPERWSATLVFDTIRAEAPSLGDAPMVFDSTDLTNKAMADNPAFAGYRALTGKSIAFTIDQTGRVHSVTGARAILEAAANNPDFTAEQRHGVAAFRDALSDAAMTELLNKCFYVLPAQPIKPGDSWTIGTTTPLPMVGGVKSTGTATVQPPITDGDTRIDSVVSTSTLSLDSAQAGPLAAMMTTKVTPGAKTESSLRFNTTLGRLVEFQSSTHLPLELTMKAGALSAPQPGEKPSVTRGHVGSQIRTELLPAPAPDAPKP